MRRPRDYQVAAITAIRDAYKSGKKGVVVELFTGAGKGYVIAAIARMVNEKKGRVCVAVNRDNLCNQLFASLAEQGLFPTMERGQDKASPMSDVVVASIQTCQGKRLEKWARNHFSLIITDEIHFGAANSFKKFLDYFAGSFHLGLSATIERHDKKGLWKGYEDCIFSMPLQKGIEEGWLVPFDFEELPVPIKISDQLATKRQFTEEDESNLFSTNDYLPRLFREAASRSHGKRGLFFWPNCASSEDAAAAFRDAGLESRHVDGYMSKNTIADLLEWFKAPGSRCLHNADLLSYGYDNPSIDLIGIMRLSRSIPMLKQRLGRGTRPLCRVDDYDTAESRVAAIESSVKPSVKVLDLMIQLGEVKNKFATPTALITEDDDDRKWLEEERRKNPLIPLTIEEMSNMLKVKKETDREKMLAKLAEDAANAARRASVKKAPPYIADILRNRDPAHKPASDAFIKHVRRLGAEIPPGDYSAFQIMRVKVRLEKQKVAA